MMTKRRKNIKTKDDRIFLGSLFYKYVNDIFQATLKSIAIADRTCKEKNQSTFFKSFVEQIVMKYFPMACFQSNGVVAHVNENIEIISNSRVEQFLRLVNHSILKHHLHQSYSYIFSKTGTTAYGIFDKGNKIRSRGCICH